MFIVAYCHWRSANQPFVKLQRRETSFLALRPILSIGVIGWSTLKPNQRECASQQLFFVGKDDLLRREAYEEFIDFRAEKIAEKLNEFLELGAT